VYTRLRPRVKCLRWPRVLSLSTAARGRALREIVISLADDGPREITGTNIRALEPFAGNPLRPLSEEQ
jgi:hypothetical protein